MLLCRLLNGLSLVANLLQGLEEVLGRRLVGVVGDGNLFGLQIRLDAFHTLLEAQVALDFLLTVFAVHLRLGGYDQSLDVLGL